MNWFLEPLMMHLCDLGWRDIVEILFFTTIIYVIQRWLSHDTQKPLLAYWYTYCGLWITASLCNFSTITYALLILLPTAVTLFVLIHQRTLQKNYLALRAITPPPREPDNWLDVLIQMALSNINAHKPLWAVIELKDALDTMLVTPLPLQATMKKELLTLLLDSCEPEKLIWLSADGKIRGINATWITPTDALNTPASIPAWQQDALFFTAVTDAIVLYAQYENRTFTIITKGRIIENMTAHQAQRSIKDCYSSAHTASAKKGETIHGSYHSPAGPQQHSVS